VAVIQWKWKPDRTKFKVRLLKVTQECQTRRSEVGGGSGKGNERAITAFVFLGTAAQRYRVIIFKFKLPIDKKKGNPHNEGFQKTIKKMVREEEKRHIYVLSSVKSIPKRELTNGKNDFQK
jgi:hypothetical protein